jgi:hypothetical protein
MFRARSHRAPGDALVVRHGRRIMDVTTLAEIEAEFMARVRRIVW